MKLYEKSLQKEKLRDLINRGARFEKPTKVRRNAPPLKLSQIKNIVNSNQLDSSHTFRLDGIGSKTMHDSSPRGGYNFNTDDNTNLSHRIQQKRSPAIQLNSLSVEEPIPNRSI